MRIPPYWSRGTFTGTNQKGREETFRAWGWSFDSLAEAQNDAVARAKRIFEHFISNVDFDRYDYVDVPLREEILHRIGEGDDEIAVITRNRYGAMVLNAASVCFVDVDFPPVRGQGLVDSIGLIFSKQKRQQRQEEIQDATLMLVREWAARNPQRSFRLYRTAAGLRLLFTDRLYDPTSSETAELLGELKSDWRYRKLTEKQACFRARLTPKPWRCHCKRPPGRYPFDDGGAEEAYHKWLENYEEKSRGYATCHLIESNGRGAGNDVLDTIIEVHDRYSCGASDTELA
ncbi:MAG: hypothetical protein JXM70_02185 [Pirellulales bacterium]|nr:hypothetical protein [Pirellulales bacterium]